MLNASPGPLSIAAVIAGAVVFLAFAVFSLVSYREKEKRPARRALFLAFALALPFWVAGLIEFPLSNVLAGALLMFAAGALTVLFLPSPPARPVVSDAPAIQNDERDTMFSRRDLEPGSARFHAYYERHPEKKPLDDVFRSKPGLLAEGALHYDPATFAAAEASLTTVKSLWPMVDREPSPEKTNPDPAEISRFIERWALGLGAVSAGITETRDYHWYRTLGRGERYGKPGPLGHTHAVAIAVEMDKSMVDSAPRGPTVMESSQQYMNAGVIAVQIAEFIRRLGYSARAHIDGNYHVVAPLVARDAGLGEIGRIGLLMTPTLGPRVRLSVVTTDLPLVARGGAAPGGDGSAAATSTGMNPQRDPTVTDFCMRCKKCAAACPARALPFDEPREIDGALRWRVDSEACFTYWCIAGTDCARCMSVCPFSHPNTFPHNLVRRGIRSSAAFRRLALTLDDFFYGKVPPPHESPEWTRVGTGLENHPKFLDRVAEAREALRIGRGVNLKDLED